MGWIAVDLDGTLAQHRMTLGWTPMDPGIGEPVPEMLERVKQWIADGKDVRIFTARASEQDEVALMIQLNAIIAWCVKYIGKELPITCSKDWATLEIWDDRAVSVELNTGKPLIPMKEPRGSTREKYLSEIVYK
jgi:hypothetical protein